MTPRRAPSHPTLPPNPLAEIRGAVRAMHPGLAADAILQIPVAALLKDPAPEAAPAIDGIAWRELYYSLFKGAPTDDAIPSLDELNDLARPHQKSGVTPLVIANYTYEALRPGSLDLAADGAKQPIVATLREGLSPADAFVHKDDFFITALVQDQFDYFLPRNTVLFGLNQRFLLASEFYLSNTGDTLTGLQVDFGDGRGPRAVAFDQVTDVTYADSGAKHIKLTARAGDAVKVAELTFDLTEPLVPLIDETWTNLNFDTDPNMPVATGHAWVFYGNDNGQKHTGIVNPIIISEGFPGNYTVSYLWWSLTTNAQNLANRLLDMGKDVIILGYDDGTTYLESNAGVVVACVQQAIAERQGDAPLIVGGACMGGVVVRYALAYMEANNIAHQTSLYFSIDSPHLGINAPAGVQYLLGLLKDVSGTAAAAYEKLHSFAGQELLLDITSWLLDPPSAPSGLRQDFMQKLASLGEFPKLPKKIGIADGVGNGVGNGVPAGSNVLVDSEYAYLYSAPGDVDDDNLMFGGLWADDCYWPSCPFSIDSAPGSVEAYFGTAAAALGATATFDDCCFVPTISALSMSTLNVYSDGDLYVDLDQPIQIPSDLDAYIWNDSNGKHMQITAAMADWLIAQTGSASVLSGTGEAEKRWG